MSALDDLKQSLNDLQTQVSTMQNNVQSRIDDAVAAYAAKDQAEDDKAFDEAIRDIRNMTSQLAQQTTAVHQTAVAIAPTDLPATVSPTDAGTPASPVPPVQTTQSATTDPTGTAAVGGGVVNVPDGTMSTAAPGAETDPATGAPVAQAGSPEAPTDLTTASPTGTVDTGPNPAGPTDADVDADERREDDPSQPSTTGAEPPAGR